ncbi:uncharacterized protein, partial [Parasteatoda tepidariorum]|uniref:uncharacterized protein n=1 Tax=Parasteatoda tepidariorum TaxID=114398 RepID=UPI0039BCD5B4
MAKLMERMVVNRLNWFPETNDLLRYEPAGFRKNRSTAYQVAHLSQMPEKLQSSLRAIILQELYPSDWIAPNEQLFNVYINDLILALRAVLGECLLFADDLIMWIQVERQETEKLLNRALQVLFNWSNITVNL